MLSALESLEWILCSIPLYWELKLAFIVWLVMPKRDSKGGADGKGRAAAYPQGAMLLYENYVRKLIKMHEPRIDQNLDLVYSTTSAKLSELRTRFGGVEEQEPLVDGGAGAGTV